MAYTLFIGDYSYSSWSLRGWLLLDAFGFHKTVKYANMRTPAFESLRAAMAPSRLVPAVALPDATLVWDTMAIAETLHERHPDAGMWPTDASQRATARALAAEMHSGFPDLRAACPMNMRTAYAGFQPLPAVRADLDRLSALWAHARTDAGPFLFGAFTAADAFFAPVASRIATYGLEMPPEDMAYVAALLDHPSVRRWRAMGQADPHVQQHYAMDLPLRANPHDPALTGTAAMGPSENANCPYSGKPVVKDSIMDVQGRKIGFCNPFCRDKTAADPMAWPQVAAMLSG